MAKRKVFSTIEFIHFNDVYNVESRTKEPVGGAARMVHRIGEIRKRASENALPEPVVIFSGDAFNPSVMSTITQGKQMVPVLNAAKVAVAVYGNHDFDFGVEQLEKLASQCKFPWLMSNVVNKSTKDKLADGEETVVQEIAGHKVGFLGVVEREWLETLATIDVDDVEYEDYCVCARRLATKLRADGCELVVALSHMRVPNDVRLATECGDVVDLVLGGHDHHYAVKKYGEHDIYVCKSGTDFRQMTVLRIEFSAMDRPKVVDWCCENITSEVEEDADLKEELSEYASVVSSKMGSVVGSTCVPLDCRFSSVRTRETNIANFVADMLRRATDADVALLNAGTLRTDAIVDVGQILMQDLVNLLPMGDQTTVIRISGAQLLDALENGVSQYPRLEGRFPCVSGVRFTFDAAKNAGSRVVDGSVSVGGNALDLNGRYTVVTKSYLAQGKDGYDSFKDGEVVLDDETGPMLPTLLRNTFAELEVLDSMKARRRSVLRGIEKWKKLAHVDHDSQVKTTDGCSAYGIRPMVDGRITCLNAKEVPES
ncbi:mannosylglucosyl-3-phosphoglycerate phosphatase-like [Sycon ciliatum]|uniref:mannosylglucosyl-3-phosphoglycerate phosphatase-like n=1 Tax=Sycon ciliatum TaxID=27933 RepID=UPI0031F71115